MLFGEANEGLLKTYVVDKLNDISDADADVLGSYVLALLKHEQPAEEVRQICIQQLEDFLTEHTVPFVNEVFHALETKSYLTNASLRAASMQSTPTGPAAFHNQTRTNDTGNRRNFRGRGRGRSQPDLSGPPPVFPSDMTPEMMAAMMAAAPMGLFDWNGESNVDIPPFAATSPTNGQGRGRGKGRGRGGSSHQFQRRSSISKPNPSHPNSTSLVVEGIPRDKQDEGAIQEYFAKFGTLNNVRLERGKNRAILEYANHWEAQNAWQDPSPIFDNRFVKVFWLKSKSYSDGRGEDDMKVDEPELDLEEFNRRQAEAQKLHEEKTQRKQATQRAIAELERKREELAKKQSEERRFLMERMGTIATGAQKSQIGSPSNLTETLKAQLAKLQAEADALGVKVSDSPERGGYRGRGRGRGYSPGYSPYARGGFRGRGGGRGAVVHAPSRKLDNRQKRVSVIGAIGKSEELRSYLLGIGDYESIEADPEKDEIQVIAFRDRATAEKFVRAGSNIPRIGKVSLAWTQSTNTVTPMDSTQDVDMNGERRIQYDQTMDDDEGLFDEYA